MRPKPSAQPERAAKEEPTDEEWFSKELFLIYRDYIKHEDTLAQYRISWLLVLTALMLTTYITLYGLLLFSIWGMLSPSATPLDTQLLRDRFFLFIPISLLSVFGIITAVTCGYSLRGAVRASSSIERAWTQFEKERPHSDKDRWLPGVTFGFGKKTRPVFGYPMTICVAICLIWITSLFADAFLLGYYNSISRNVASDSAHGRR